MPFPVVPQGLITFVLGFSRQLLGPRHVAAELAAMFLLDDMHFVDGSLQIVRCSHCLVVKLIGESHIGRDGGAYEHEKSFGFHFLRSPK
jgi:hypothetical protein